MLDPLGVERSTDPDRIYGTTSRISGFDSSMKEIHRLSDAWEFKETEIMNTRGKLRSLRASLAVLEGKIALKNIEAQGIVEEKQWKIGYAQKALQLLRTACIVWPNPASEVWLAGSFDGWTSQRRMERSSSGIFCLNLKLYPGKYEVVVLSYFSGLPDRLLKLVNLGELPSATDRPA
ncbi:hypothetical protein QJS10_CPA10g00312 [Acorus calamus]|uniref:AMP-activated protein kinase glycogen-binding domain-containing protein n=1 Tax=Acorus calamus TaxID=4465 RepID=A0AAV9E0F5_ACOCL|nr:hypothetical protein QJS10_CPA10g00312 [Acorus calamus]